MTKKEADAQPVAVKTIEELILDYKLDKYAAIPLAAMWAKELRRKEENRHLTANELLELALREVLDGKVNWKNIQEILAASGAPVEPPAAAGDAKKSKE